MSDERLKIISDLLVLHGRIADLDGDRSRGFLRVTDAIHAVRDLGEHEASPGWTEPVPVAVK